jgi:threonine aldolase
LQKIGKVCKEHHLAYHLDGARLFNALVAKSETPKQYGNLFDTISICLSKGLGAPIGSVLLGNKKDIKQAIRIRKLYGGAMRQVGYLAAAGIYALDNHVDRLALDHERAKKLGEALDNSEFIKKVEPIQTNIIIFYVNDKVSETEFVNVLKEKEILIISMGNDKLRMVTHLDFTDEMLKMVLKEIENLKMI